MEQEFYRDEFEQLLKDTTEDFKMYPSRKVWHSIYNDLHPDRKWPSFAVCLFLLTIILYVGVNNNNAINNESRRNTLPVALNNAGAGNEAKDKIGIEQEVTGKTVPADQTALTAGNLLPHRHSTSIYQAPAPVFTNLADLSDAAADNSTDNGRVVDGKESDRSVNTSNVSFENAATFTTDNRTAITVVTPGTDRGNSSTPELNTETNETSVPVAFSALPQINTEVLSKTDLAPALPLANSNALVASNKSIQKDTREREWIEDYAFHNAPNLSKKLFRGLSTQFYVTPSIGYRVMFKNRDYKYDDNALVTNNAARTADDKTELNQQATMNLEAGLAVLKDMGKKWRIKAGIQFNYTDYLTYAQKLDHPTQTNLVLDDQLTGTTISSYNAEYANIPGKNDSKLHNRTLQLSVPIGMDYKLLSNRTLNWHVGATLQPTYVTRGYSYLLSTDKNYLVEDPALIRKLNLNGAIESFVSIKLPSGTFVNLGPQFRYQLLSMHSKSYLYTEKPYSVGFKIGFTRPL